MKMKKLILILMVILFVACGASTEEKMTSQREFNLAIKVIVHPEDEGIMSPPVAGRAYCDSMKLIVEGYWVDDKLMIKDRFALGHEVNNLLKCKYPDVFFNPEKRKE